MIPLWLSPDPLLPCILKLAEVFPIREKFTPMRYPQRQNGGRPKGSKDKAPRMRRGLPR